MKKLAILLAAILTLAGCAKTEAPSAPKESVSSEESISSESEAPAAGMPDDPAPEGTVMIPSWMHPHSVIVYDEALNYTFLEGSEETPEDYEKRVADGAVDVDDPLSWWLAAEPYIKVEYDLHGFLQNIYYPSPYVEGDYQLERPHDWPVMGTEEWYARIKK